MSPSGKRKRTTAPEDSSPPAKLKKTSSNRSKTSYTASQKNAIADFVAFTNTDKTTAARLLRQYAWNTELAANAYFNGGAPSSNNASKPALNKLFDKYREDAENEPDEVNIEGTMQLLQDLDISPEDVSALIFSELVKSPSLGKLTRTEFVDNLAVAGVTDGRKIGETVQKRRKQLADASFRPTFKSIYKHTFLLARQPGQKAVALDMATEYWRLLFAEPSLQWSTADTPWLEWWIEFLETKYKKSVNKDMWDQTLVFAEKTLGDEAMSFWSEDSAWPGVIDEFVEFVKTDKRGSQGQGGEAMEVE